jgi:Calcineurin-like phosphoesterase
MHTRRRLLLAVVVLAPLLSSVCAPQLPPTAVPPTDDPALEPLRVALKGYIDQTQPYRKEAAQAAEQVPGKAMPSVGAETAVRTRQKVLAEALKTKLRPNAQPGEILGDGAAAAIRKTVDDVFNGPKHDLLMDALAEQNDAGQAAPQTLVINEHTDAPRTPALLNTILPPLPKQLEYGFAGRTLLLRDVDADVVVDYLPDTLPQQPPAGVPTVPPEPVQGAASPLPMPSIRGGRVFALMGDSGSGDLPQKAVAQAMLTYFTTARRFPFVLMLGDNLYDDDYTGEFSEPYKPLLDRGVAFYAALGNHDRDLEIHFKPFNMNDRDYYTFDQGNVRFAVLNSNHASDPAQAKWLDTVFTDAGSKWRICFFHHPLYSSGQHADESREVIRPALEPVLTRNGVNVVFSGHEHEYERVAPQHGIRYFVSGGGGRSLYDVHPQAFDEVAVSEHHFMVAEVAGDRLFFEAITPAQKVLDCGVIYRTADAEAKPDKDTQTWMTACRAARPMVTTHAGR